MRLIFVRHAEPDYANNTLTEKGFREAQLLKDRIKEWKVDGIYTSPLERAKLTAEPFLKEQKRSAKTLEWMKEFYFLLNDPLTGEPHGPWDFYPEYWTRQESFYDRDNWFEDPVFRETKGYSEAVFALRTGLDDLLAGYGFERTGRMYRFDDARPEEDADKTLMFFGHLGSNLEAIGYLLGYSPVLLQQTVFLPPTGLCILNAEMRINRNAMFRAQCFGDVSHLHEANEPLSRSGCFSSLQNG